MRLIHVEQGVFGQFKSDVRSEHFYLSGKAHPLDELKATLRAFHQEDTADKEHAICRFPARYIWLKQRAPELLQTPVSLKHCKKLQQWPAMQKNGAINLVHVSGYMGNPGSAFGHLLLRIGKKSDTPNRGLLDIGINFGAKIPPAENMLMYMIKGIGGGYDSSFSADRHYLRDHVYAESESRDMWAYELNLSQEQRQLLLLHLWELRNTAFSYYFLQKNCAWRIAQLLEIVLDKNIVPSLRPYYMPVDVFHAVDDLSNDTDFNLVNRISFLPSEARSTTLSFNTLELSKKQRMRELIRQQEASTIDDSWSSQELEILIDYSSQKISDSKTQADFDAWTTLRLKALQQRLSTEGSTSRGTTFSMPPPGEGLRHQMLRLGVYNDEQEEKGVTLSVAPFSYESLDRNRGSLANGVFRGGVFNFEYRDQQSKLDSLELIKVARLRGQASIERSILDFAWRGSLVADRSWRSEYGDLRPQFNAAIGQTIGKHQTSAYGLLQLKSNLKSFELQAGIALGAVGFVGDHLSLQWESSQLWHQDYDDALTTHTLQARYRLGRSQAFDIEFSRQQKINSWQLAYQFRW
ncbi:MAG: DUF4105 domain-containing protein [Granulosicoccaceae bacterium]